MVSEESELTQQSSNRDHRDMIHLQQLHGRSTTRCLAVEQFACRAVNDAHAAISSGNSRCNC